MLNKSKKIHFFSWDDRRDIAHPGDAEMTIVFAVEHFINCAKEAIKLHGFFAVALSGGKTSKAMYSVLSRSPYLEAIDWSNVLLFWSDERSDPPTSPENNFRMAMDAGLKNLSIPSENIFRMVAETEIEKHAEEYEKKVREVLGNRPFDLIMLGMGTDGHTASLFPGTNALTETKRWVVANHIPHKKIWRMTMTLPCINRAKNIVVYVIGKEKKEIVGKVFLETRDPPYPISLVGTPENKALFVLDTESGELILK
jgi:6-phosphogluconolactonase